jgi:hypothetical protein
VEGIVIAVEVETRGEDREEGDQDEDEDEVQGRRRRGSVRGSFFFDRATLKEEGRAGQKRKGEVFGTPMRKWQPLTGWIACMRLFQPLLILVSQTKLGHAKTR